jgi:hypothetical protein
MRIDIQMKKITLLLLSIVIINSINAQCIKGDCNNGTGSYDFGFARYDGEFKNGKPNGNGVLDFGGGDKYEGEFKDGVEHGKGLLFKQNKVQEVTYVNGKIVKEQQPLVIGGNAIKVEGCLTGDCYNGYGEIKFTSGSVYKGNFEYGLRSGNGTFYFASGNILKGNFKNDLPINGEFKYPKEGVVFIGSFNEKGEPQTGTYSYPNFGSTVKIVNSKITLIDNPEARKADSLVKVQKEGVPCSACGGKGMIAGTASTKTTESYYSIHYVNSSNELKDISFGNTRTETKVVYSPPTSCSKCNGKGKTSGMQEIRRSLNR